MKSLSRGPSPLVSSKIPTELLSRLDQAAREHKRSRSAVLRDALDYALSDWGYECAEEGAK